MISETNLFLSGVVGVGKSTLLRKVLERFRGKYGGFETFPVRSSGMVRGYALKPFDEDFSDEWPLVARRISRGFVPLQETFNDLGTKLLQQSRKEMPDAVVMDEIGFFETRAEAFHGAVMSCLESSLFVFGVLKKCDAPLPRKIRQYPGVLVVEVTFRNREMLPDLLEAFVRHGDAARNALFSFMETT